MTWQTIVAGFINSTVVLTVIYLFNKYVTDWIREKAPWAVPFLAGALGPAVVLAQNWLSAWLGQPIDLSPWLGLFTGASAVAMHQVYKQVNN